MKIIVTFIIAVWLGALVWFLIKFGHDHQPAHTQSIMAQEPLKVQGTVSATDLGCSPEAAHQLGENIFNELIKFIATNKTIRVTYQNQDYTYKLYDVQPTQTNMEVAK